MKQGKGRKNKPIAKVKSKPSIGNKLNAQLAEIGLKIINVVADGNCLFRAIADQLEGNEEEHTKYRQMVIDHIENHRKEFEPFVEDEVPFEEYCMNMRNDGTWAGHMELQAASLVTQTNICIHRLLSPRWQIRNFEKKKVPCMHLSYHDGEHYNSVRKLDDNGIGPAKPIALESNEKPMVEPSHKKKKPYFDKVSGGIASTDDSLRLVVARTDCLDEDVGLANAGTEFVACEDNNIDDNTLSRSEEINNLMNSDNDNGNYQGDKVQKFSSNGHVASSMNGNKDDDSLQRKTELCSGPQKVARNKACPCGSKKKYKACCGATREKSTARVLTRSPKRLTNKERKKKVQNIVKQTETTDSSNYVLDLGSLSI